MLTELELSGIADFLTNSNDLMSWEDQAAYLESEYGIEPCKAKELVETFHNQFCSSSIVMEDIAIIFINNFLLKEA